MKRQYAAVVILILSFLVFIFIVLPALNLNEFIESLKSTDIFLFSLAIVALLISNGIASLRWSILLQKINAKGAQLFFNAFGMFCVGQVAGLIVPSRVGNYSKVPLVRKMDKLSYEAIISAVNAETILDLAYICCAGVVSIFILSAFFSAYPYFSTILVVLILLILFGSYITLYNIQKFQPFYDRLFSIAANSNRNWLIRILEKCLLKLIDLIKSTRNIFSKRMIIAQLSGLTIITQLFGVLGMFFIIESVHVSLQLTDIFAILTITYIVGIASLIPGGFGASDLSLIALLGYEGVSLPDATNIVILWRIAMYLPIIVVTGIFFISGKIGKKEIVEK